MDPALRELLTEETDDEVKALIRLRKAEVIPAGIRVVTRFGEIATCRLKRQAIPEIWADDDICSLKAPRILIPEPVSEAEKVGLAETTRWVDERRPEGLPETGRGVVIGIADWGCDFAHPDFLHPDGTTRLLALWDQRGPPDPSSLNRYGYGTIYFTEEINRALQDDEPYQTLGYHPADGDPNDSGSHGAHVTGIAAGNGREGGPVGVAPEAELIFVHLSTGDTGGLSTLGDSVTLLEAVDFIIQTAGDRPCVINLSVGRHGGPHDGSTLVEQGFDALVSEAPGRAIVQSTGNYFDRSIHATGQLRPGDERTLKWLIDRADQTPNELEIWYSGRDIFEVEVHSPEDFLVWKVPLGEQASFKIDEQEVGRIYHRAFDPNNQHHHINMFLDPGAPAGIWQVTLSGHDVVDGRFHAWVERDAACFRCQSYFELDDDDPSSTTGTICNGFRTIAVGAYNAHSADRELASFSSAGPTRDGRQKPDCVAPGVQVLAPRSAPRNPASDRPLYVRKSGTSMAAPHVTGTIACMFEVAPRLLTIQETRNALLSSAIPVPSTPEVLARFGSGYLNIEQAIELARQIGKRGTTEVPGPGDEEKQSLKEEIMNNSLLDEIPHESRTRNFILVSGGPGLYDDRDVEHDKSWANYVTPPLLLTDSEAKRNSFIETDEEVWWLVYKPAYIRRWEDDLKRKRRSTQEVKDKGFASYVDLIEARARSRGWNLSWFDSASEFWTKLKTFNDPISRVWYWGHASGGLWLTLAHSEESIAVAPDSSAIITTSDVSTNAGLAKRFQAGSSSRIHRFVGCNTDQFAEIWAKTFKVWTEGYNGKVDFGDIHKTGGEPSLVGSASRKRFSSSGTEVTVPEGETQTIKTDEENRYDVEDWDLNPEEDDPFDYLIPPETEFEDEEIDECLAAEDVDAWEVVYDPANEQPGASLVEAVDEIIGNAGASYVSSTELLHQLIAETGATEAVSPLGNDIFPAPVIIFDAATGRIPALEPHFEQLFEVVAYPGEQLPELLEVGDLLLRRGEGNLAHLAVLSDMMTIWADELAAARLTAEAAGPGLYVQVIEAGPSPHNRENKFSRRLSRDGWRLDQDNLILRLRPNSTTLPSEMFGEELDVARAVRLNQVWSNRLGWAAHADAIVRLLHTAPFTPGPEEFARLVYEWQQSHGLTADGIIGPQTWRRMQALLGVEPAPPPPPSEPGNGPTSRLGTLRIDEPTRYRFSYIFTPDDLLWTARFIVGEAGGRDDPDNQAVIWAMFNRYAFFTHRVYSTFQGFLRRYSTPLQPVLNSSGAARRHMHRSDFVRTGGFYSGTSIPRGQLERHLNLQRTPWDQLPDSARALAERALRGQVPNPIGTASEFASTRIYFRDRYGRNPSSYEEWRRFTEAYTRGGRWRWIGPVNGLDQMRKNAFFIDRRVASLPANTVQVVTMGSGVPSTPVPRPTTPTAPQPPPSIGGQAINAATGPDLLTAAQLEQAVQQNRHIGQALRWWPLFTPISVYYLRFRQQPREEEFAQAVARWQQAVGGGLNVNGVIDRATWRVMRPRGEPSNFSTTGPQGSLQRPRTYSQVVETFGDPAVQHEVWARQNIVRIFAPQGFQFRTLAGGPRNYIRGHRKLKPLFEALFREIAEANLWDSLQPVSGPFNFRNVRGGRRLSMHAFGIALDVRPNDFPRGQNRNYPPIPLVELFRDHGFHWGIFFPTPDPHHFQFATGT